MNEPENMKQCPACGERISAVARKCKNCGEYFVVCRHCSGETGAGFTTCHLCGGKLSDSKDDLKSAAGNNAHQMSRPEDSGRPVSPPPPQTFQQRYEQQYRMTQAATKDFVTPSIVSFLLYYVGCFIVGLVVNVIYIGLASKAKQETGVTPNGMGCLIAVLIFNIFVLIVLIFAAMKYGFDYAHFLKQWK